MPEMTSKKNKKKNLSVFIFFMEQFPWQAALHAEVLCLCQHNCLYPPLQTELEVNRLAADKISHFFLQVPLHFYHNVLLCLIINDMIFVSWGGCFTSLKKSSSEKWRMGTPRRCTTQSKRKRKMVIMFSVFEQQPLQRPVKIAYSVYCVFDPVGNTLKRQRGEIKWIFFPYLRKTPIWVIFWLQSTVYQERLFYSTLWSTAVLKQTSQNRGCTREVRKRERREAVRKGLQWGYPASINVVAEAKYAFWIMTCVTHLTENLRLKNMHIQDLGFVPRSSCMGPSE